MRLLVSLLVPVAVLLLAVAQLTVRGSRGLCIAAAILSGLAICLVLVAELDG